MLSRGLTCALRLRSRALSSSVPSNTPITSVFEAPAVPQGSHMIPSRAFSTSNVCGIFAAGGSLQQEGPSTPSTHTSSTKRAVSQSHSPTAVRYIHKSRTIAAEQALVTRLASVWGMPPEVLASNVAALSDLLKPCGRDTAAHALWVLVRCPVLRHMTDQQVRNTVRSLHQHFPEISKPAFKATVYKHPWVLDAELQSLRTAAAAAAADKAEPHQKQQRRPALTPWKQELALMMLELQAGSSEDGSSSSSSDGELVINNDPLPRVSSAGALAGVKLYLAAAEASMLFKKGLTWTKLQSVSQPQPAATKTDSSAATAPAAATRREASQTASSKSGKAPAAGNTVDHCSAAAAAATVASGTKCEDLQQQQSSGPLYHQQKQQQQQLQQLVHLCPSLTVLPPDLLASRWQLLLSVLLGQAESAAAVVVTNPYLMVQGYAGAARSSSGSGGGGSSGGSSSGGGGLSDWDYSQLAGLV